MVDVPADERQRANFGAVVVGSPPAGKCQWQLNPLPDGASFAPTAVVPTLDVFVYTYDDCGRDYPDEAVLRIASAGVRVVAAADLEVPGILGSLISWDEVRGLARRCTLRVVSTTRTN
jgi:hypothetical protein